MSSLEAQQPLYDESKLPEYELPELLVDSEGNRVTTKEQWEQHRRPEILSAFQEHVFGTMPSDTHQVTITTDLKVDKLHDFVVDPSQPNEKKISGRVRALTLTLTVKQTPAASPSLSQTLQLLVITPGDAQKASPAFLAYNFMGNATIDACPHIPLGQQWDTRAKKRVALKEKQRGTRAGRWPVGLILSRGNALVTLNYGDIDPDYHDEFKNGVHRFFPDLQQRTDNWSAIGAWAWGLHRVLDYLETDDLVDAKRVVVFGHSRLGKTSLWTGATDTRIAGVISNNSGCGGAALSRRRFGESVRRINTVFPHWFAARHLDYNDNENACPVDHHMLVALMAPRPVYIASAEGDRWADPKGEFLSAIHAGPAYRLFGKQSILSNERSGDAIDLPEVEKPVGTDVRYHIRRGKHDVKRYDWLQYLDFADYVFAQP